MSASPREKQLAAARAMMRNDPLLTFKPSPVQDLFLRSTSAFRYVSGGNRTGKTTVNTVDLAYIARGIHPVRKFDRRVRIAVLTNTRQQAAQVFGRKLFVASELPGPNHDKPLIPAVDIVKIRYQLDVPYTASTACADILFSWSGVDDIWERLQGLKLDEVYLDEDAGDEKLINELYMRGLDVRSNLKEPWAGGISWSATPTCGSEGLRKFKTFCDLTPTESSFMIPSGENPAISAAAISEARKFLGAEVSSIRVDGTADAESLVQIYAKQWSDARHMRTEDYKVQPEDNIWIGWDPGTAHPTGMIAIAITPEAPITLNVVQCWCYRRQTIDYDARMIDEWLCGRRIAGIVYDHAAAATEKSSGTSVLAQFRDKLRERGVIPLCGFVPAKKQREAGIGMVRHYLDPSPYDKNTPPLIRINPSPASEGMRLREQMIRYRGKEATRFTGAGGVVKKDDDLVDAMRYLVMKRPAYNSDWNCGRMTKVITQVDTAPTDIADLAPKPELKPYERHLLMSRARKPVRGSWLVRDF